MARNCLLLCLAETKVLLDPAALEAIIQLVIHSAGLELPPSEGVSVNTFYNYPKLPTLWRWNACYFNPRTPSISFATRSLDTFIERRLLSNFDRIPSISKEFGAFG